MYVEIGTQYIFKGNDFSNPTIIRPDFEYQKNDSEVADKNQNLVDIGTHFIAQFVDGQMILSRQIPVAFA